MEEQKYSMDPFETQGNAGQQQVYTEQNEPAQTASTDAQQEDAQTGDDPEMEKSSCVIMAIIFVALVLIGIGAWYYLNRKSEQTPPPAIADEEDKNFVKADKGAHLYFPEGLEIIIPAGALEKDTEIDAALEAKANPSKGEVTDLYHLMPDGLHFQKPVTLLVPYKPVEGFSVYDTQLGYRFTNYGQKQLLEYEVEASGSGKKLRTQVDKF